MQDGALDHALEAQCRLGIDFVRAVDGGRVFLDVIVEVATQVVEIGAAGTQDFGRGRIVYHGEQQVLDRDQLVAFLPSIHKGHV